MIFDNNNAIAMEIIRSDMKYIRENIAYSAKYISISYKEPSVEFELKNVALVDIDSNSFRNVEYADADEYIEFECTASFKIEGVATDIDEELSRPDKEEPSGYIFKQLRHADYSECHTLNVKIRASINAIGHLSFFTTKINDGKEIFLDDDY